MPRLSLSLLGTFHVELNGQHVTSFESVKVRALLAYLATEASRPHRREALATLLWPDWPQQSAMRNLRNALLDLRKNIGDREADPPFLLITRDTLQLNLEADVGVDVVAFEQGIKNKGEGIGGQQSSIRNLQTTIEDYQGAFLEGFSLPDSPDFEQWALARREDLHRQALQALFTLGEAYEQQDELDQALACARRQVELESWHEPGQQQLMRLLALTGQRTAALAQYEALRQALADELAVEPSAETKRLYEAIRDENLQGIGVKGIGEGESSPIPYPLPPVPGEPPFKGLQYFDVPDAPLFFGREALTARLVGHIRQMVEASEVGATHPTPDVTQAGETFPPGYGSAARDGSPLPTGWSTLAERTTPAGSPLQEACCFLAVVGASGSGKSSVVRAGLVPALQKDNPLVDGDRAKLDSLPPEGSQNWHIHVFTPTSHPLEALAVSLTQDAKSVNETTQLLDDLRCDTRNLHMYARRMLTPQQHRLNGKCWLLLVVDQFEELFTQCHSEAERTAFLDNLLTAVQDGGPTLVIVVLRADFYGHCAQYPGLRQALCSRQEYIGPMDVEELRYAIEEPARRNGWEFEPGLVDLILRDTGVAEDHPPEPGALPLLEHALLETWRRRSERTLTLQGYDDSGGVHGAIAKTAENVFARLTSDQQALARRIFLRLTELGEGTQDTRRRASLAELSPTEDVPQAASLLKTLADARLITLAEDTAEVAHEALIREWPALRAWLNEDREGLHLHRHLTESAEAWSALQRDRGELYRGARLARALEWAEANPEELNTLEREYLQASQAQVEREAAEREASRQRELSSARRLARTRQQRSLVLSVGLLIAILLGVLSFSFYRQSDKNLVSARAANTQVAAVAATADANASIALGRQAIAQAQLIPLDTWSHIAQSGLLTVEGLQRAPEVAKDRVLLQALGKYARPVSPSIWHAGKVNTVAFSPDGHWVVSGSGDGTVRVWDAATGIEAWSHTSVNFRVNAVTFSPDGSFVVSGGSDSMARVWDASSGVEQAQVEHVDFEDCHSSVTSVAVSPDGRWFMSGASDNTARLWMVAGDSEAVQLSHTGGVADVAFNPDGSQVVTASADGTARIWNASTGDEVARMTHEGGVNSVAFSPDGQWVISGSVDGTARVWNASTGREVTRMTHEGGVNSVAFSPDGQWVISGSVDGTASVWWAATGIEVARMTHERNVSVVAFSPDGRRVVSGSWDGTARIWDAATGREITRMVHEGPVNAVAFSPDGNRIVTASDDHTARVWDINPQVNVVKLPLEVNASVLAFSQDQSQAVTGNASGVVQVWNLDDGSEIARPAKTGAVNAVAFSLDGNRVASAGADRRARVWVVTTGNEVISVNHENGVNAVAFSPDGHWMASGSIDGILKIWDLTSDEEIRQIKVDSSVTALAFSPDGSRIVSGSLSGKVQLWQVDTGKETKYIDHYAKVTAVAFSPDGRWVISCSIDGSLRVWQPKTSVEVAPFTHDRGAIVAAFSPDGRYVITGGWDATVRVWEAATGVEVARITHESAVIAVAFSYDGQKVITGSSDGTIQVSIWQPQDLIKELCSRLPRNFTQVEWKQYFGDVKYHPTCQNLPLP